MYLNTRHIAEKNVKEQSMNWKDIVQNLEQERKSLLANSKKVYLVNGGRMNHGKSSLLNSILRRDAFAVKDVHETRVNKEVKVAGNIYLVDTPGLDANTEDDTEAYEVLSMQMAFQSKLFKRLYMKARNSST